MNILLTDLLCEAKASSPDNNQLLIMKNVIDGKSISNIASELSMTVNDVKQVLAAGMRKVNVKNLHDLTTWGLRTGIIKDKSKLTSLSDKSEPPLSDQPDAITAPDSKTPPVASVVIVDDSPVAIRGISDFLVKLGYEIVGTAINGVEAMTEVKELKPDILIIEIAIPMKNGIAVARELRDKFPNTKIVIYTGFKDKKYLHVALAVGASAYVMKTSQASELKSALTQVLNGKVYVDKELQEELTQLRPPTDRTPFETLNEKQLQLLQLMAESYTTKAIASIMNLSPKTVEYHRAALMNALNIWDYAGLVRYALKHGIIRVDENRKK